MDYKEIGAYEKVISVDEIREDYDWQEALSYASWNSGGELEPAIPGDNIDCSTFAMDDILFIMGMDEGENDASDWIVYGKLKDGRWFFLSAWCDYTGWDCQAGGRAVVAKDRVAIETFGISEEELKKMRGPSYSRYGVEKVESEDKVNRFDLMEFD